MASGKQLGDFSFKITAIIFTPGPANSLLVQVSGEGSATGYGTTMSTGTFVVGKSGSHTWCGANYLDNGDIITFTAQGTHESSGRHKWRIRDVSQLSDGQSYNVEGEIDLAARTWSGKFFEKN